MIFSVLLLFIAALIAFTLSAVCGGGASFILIPVLGIVVPGAQIPAALSLGTASSSVSRIAILWKNIRWDLVKWFIPPAIPTVWLGARLLTHVNPVFLEIILGLFLLSNLPFVFRKQQLEKPRTSHKNSAIIFLIGMATGFVSGLTGAVGLIFNRFYLTNGLSKPEIVATRAANEVILHLIKLALYASFGLLSVKPLIYGSIIAIAGIASSLGIKRILQLLSENLFQKIGYTAMVASGLFLFASGISKLNKTNFRINLNRMSDGLETSVQWKTSSFNLEFEYDDGFEIEQKITIKEMPLSPRLKADQLITGSDYYLLEEVFGFRKHYYEIYVWRKGKLFKYDVK